MAKPPDQKDNSLAKPPDQKDKSLVKPPDQKDDSLAKPPDQKDKEGSAKPADAKEPAAKPVDPKESPAKPVDAKEKEAAAKLADVTLLPGNVVNERWRVNEKLGEGGFGAVYKVTDVSTQEEFAMKVESKREEDAMVRVEAVVMRMFGRRKLQQHSCRLQDEGETPTCRYIVMQLLGKSLSELRKACNGQRFTMSTTVRIGMQCLEAIEMLHKIGFLHRDIKPSNFAMGRGEKEKRTVYMLDYGLCRQYIGQDGQLRTQRKMAGFRGTVRYASINCHQRKELGRHDDLWSFYYMLVECRAGGLPWRKLNDKDEVAKKKVETTPQQLLFCIDEPEFVRMLENLQRLQYTDIPNYVWFQLQLKQIAQRNRCLEDEPFDWEPGGESFDAVTGLAPPKKPKTKKGKVKERVIGEDKTR